MKALIALATLALSSSAFAGTYDFRCKTDTQIDAKAKNTYFAFSAKITAKSADYETVDANSDEPVKMSPADSALDLNDNFEIVRTAKGIRLISDGDGEQDTVVELYADNGFKNGYARVDLHDSRKNTNLYSTVKCSVRERN